MKGHIRTSTVIMLTVIAMLVGALGVTLSTHRVPGVESARAAAIEQTGLTSFSPVVKRSMPAVVNISSSKVVKQDRSQNNMFQDPFFRQFFGGRMPQEQRPRSQRETSLGSGVVVSPDGYILTNNHVVEGATDVKVAFFDKQEYPAKIIGTDKYTDIAVLKIDKSGLTSLPIADSGRAQVGDVVLAIGNPFGLGQTVTMGIVSALGRTGLGIERFEDFIQTDAAINRGNSGGALIDSKGELLGINTAILAGEGGGNEGVGFAIPANLAKNMMDQIMKGGKVTRGYMGIIPQELTPEMAKSFGIPNGKGVAVAEVVPDGPAFKGGLKVGDVITAVNGTPVDDANSFRFRVAAFPPNTTVHLKVARGSQQLDLAVKLGEFNLERADADGGPAPIPGGGEKGALKGVSVQSLTSDLRRQLQIPEGTAGVVITDVDEDSAASRAGLSEGDVILQVNRHNVSNVAEFNRFVKENSGDSTLLLVKHGAGTQFLVVPNR